MSQAELWEINAIYQSNMIQTFSLYLTVIFAYLATVFIVGSKLSRWEACVLTGLFVFAQAISIGGVAAYLNRSIEFLDRLDAVSEEGASRLITDASLWIVYIPALMAVGVLISIVYLYRNRSG